MVRSRPGVPVAGIFSSRSFPTPGDVTSFVQAEEPPFPAFQFRHDRGKGLFILTWFDGRIEKCRDKPARQLMVEPDPATGELRPVTKNGRPVFTYLCREEREMG